MITAPGWIGWPGVGEKGGEMNSTKVKTALLAMLGIFGFVLLLDTAGALEQGIIVGPWMLLFRCLISFLIMTVAVFGLIANK